MRRADGPVRARAGTGAKRSRRRAGSGAPADETSGAQDVDGGMDGPKAAGWSLAGAAPGRRDGAGTEKQKARDGTNGPGGFTGRVQPRMERTLRATTHSFQSNVKGALRSFPILW